MDIRINFDSEDTQKVMMTLLREALGKGRVFVCQECENIFLREELSNIDMKSGVFCRFCAKKMSQSNTPSFSESYQQQQIKTILEKISVAENEYNKLIENSRTGIDWENAIESRRLRIQTLKRQLLDARQKPNQ